MMAAPNYGRGLTHTLAHGSQPATPPPPPWPPSPPPAAPPPPPLDFILPASTVVALLLVCCVLVCIGYGALALKNRKKQKASEGEGTGDAKADGDGGEVGPEHGPKDFRRRGCTDVFCTLLFILFWFGMLYCFYLGATVGDPYSVLYGKDYLGNRCGMGNFTDRPKVIFPRIGKDILAQMPVATTAPWKLELYGLCVEECPDVRDPTVCFGTPDVCMNYDYGTEAQWRASGGSRYYYSVMPTISVVNRCIPIKHTTESGEPARCAYPICDNVTNPWMVCDTEFPSLWLPQDSSQRSRCEIKFENHNVAQLATEQPSPIVDKIADYMGKAQKIVMSLLDAQTEIVVWGVVCPTLLGFAFVVVLRFFAKTLIWASLIAIECMLLVLTLYLFVVTGLAQSILADLLASNATRALLVAASSAQDLASDAGLDLGLGGGGNGSEAGSGALDDLGADATSAIANADAAISRLIPDDLEGDAAASMEENPMLWTIGAWASLVLSLLYGVGLIVFRKKVRIAAALVKEASLVIKDRPLHVLFPFCTLAFTILLVAFFVVGMLFLGTADITSQHFTGALPLGAGATFIQSLTAFNETMESTGADIGNVVPAGLFTVKNGVYLYFLFGFLWTNELFNAFAFTSLSGSYSHWYFFRRDDSAKSRFPLVGSVYRTIRFHFGTIAFGSFVIATVQLARIIMMWIDKQTKQLQESNQTLKFAIKCLQCCLFCLEKTLKFITGYCYIYTAMQGTGFCRSCFAVFSLILGQPAQLALNTIVRLVLALIQMVAIPCACAWLCLVLLQSQGKPEPIYPAGAVAIIAFVIAQSFAVVMSCALDTLFVCCVRDKKEYKSAFMSDRLHYAFGFDKSDRKEKRAAKKAAKAAGTAEGGN
jgi:choline transporter-like protein 2/4/5